MKRVLCLAYHFPPIGGAGVQRETKFVRYLPEFGYESVVVTGPLGASGRWTPSDETLAAEIPAGTDVRRLPDPEPPESAGWRGRGERWLELGSPWSRWWIDGAVAVGRQAPDVDVIYASMSPYESGEAAARLSRELRRPWVADLRDPWALDEMMIYPTRLHRRREVARMRAVLAAADAVVMNTAEAAQRVLRRFPELEGKPVLTIPNGFDEADFEGPAPVRDDGAFRIVHTGYLHTELGRRHRNAARPRRVLGGAVPGVDILTRSHLYLLDGIAQLREREPELASSIEVHLAGVLSEGDREAGERSSGVRMLGYLPHGETIDLMRSADLLFLPMHDLPAGNRVSIVPGKTYEYLAAGPPILAAVPDGDARDLLARAGNAFLCRPGDSGAMATIVADEIRRSRAGRPTGPAGPEVVAPYERRRLTGELAAVFDGLCGRAQGRRPVSLETV